MTEANQPQRPTTGTRFAATNFCLRHIVGTLMWGKGRGEIPLPAFGHGRSSGRAVLRSVAVGAQTFWICNEKDGSVFVVDLTGRQRCASSWRKQPRRPRRGLWHGESRIE